MRRRFPAVNRGSKPLIEIVRDRMRARRRQAFNATRGERSIKKVRVVIRPKEA